MRNIVSSFFLFSSIHIVDTVWQLHAKEPLQDQVSAKLGSDNQFPPDVSYAPPPPPPPRSVSAVENTASPKEFISIRDSGNRESRRHFPDGIDTFLKSYGCNQVCNVLIIVLCHYSHAYNAV